MVTTHIRVSVSEDLVKDVTEFPTEDGAAGQWQADGVGPEGKGSFLMVSAQNDTLDGQGQVEDKLVQLGVLQTAPPTGRALALSAVSQVLIHPRLQQLESLGHVLPTQHTPGQDHAHPTVS